MGKLHRVSQTECISSLARAYGFASCDRLLNHPRNAELLRSRRNPNVLFPGDAVYIPEREIKQVEAATEDRHRFVLRKSETLLRLIVEDADGEPYASVRYELRIGDAVIEGTTASDGMLEEPIPPDAREARLVLFPVDENDVETSDEYVLKLGRLDPVAETTGVQSRLNNLGFDCGRVDGILGDKTRRALREFQSENGIEATGEVCRQTAEQLRKLHDLR